MGGFSVKELALFIHRYYNNVNIMINIDNLSKGKYQRTQEIKNLVSKKVKETKSNRHQDIMNEIGVLNDKLDRVEGLLKSILSKTY